MALGGLMENIELGLVICLFWHLSSFVGHLSLLVVGPLSSHHPLPVVEHLSLLVGHLSSFVCKEGFDPP